MMIKLEVIWPKNKYSWNKVKKNNFNLVVSSTLKRNSVHIYTFLNYLYASNFAISVYFKLTSLTEFVDFITLITKNSESNALLIAKLVLSIEIFIFIFLLIYRMDKLILYFSIMVLIAFNIINIYLIYINYNDNCYCYGNFLELSPIQSIFKNCILIFIASVLMIKSLGKNLNEILFKTIAFIFLFLMIQNIINEKSDYFDSTKISEIVQEKIEILDSVLFIDLRSRAQYEIKQIKNAVNFPFRNENTNKENLNIKNFIKQFEYKKIKIICYCDNQICSLALNFSKKVKKIFPEVSIYVLNGGLDKWKEF